MYDTITDFHRQAHALFPELARRADQDYLRHWDHLPETELDCYSWFESMANVLNHAMQRGVLLQENAAFFDYTGSVLRQCSGAVANCIDVALVENLFWQVPAAKARPYWKTMPAPLRDLYLAFHGRAPAA